MDMVKIREFLSREDIEKELIRILIRVFCFQNSYSQCSEIQFFRIQYNIFL